MRTRTNTSLRFVGAAGVATVIFGVAVAHRHGAVADPATKSELPAEALAVGRELFLREWLPHDLRSSGGDGLGPVFNDTSCVACHNQGGTGGGGPASKNVAIVSAVPAAEAIDVDREDGLLDGRGQSTVEVGAIADSIETGLRAFDNLRLLFGVPPIFSQTQSRTKKTINVTELAKFHPDFRKSRSIVLPRFGTEPEFLDWHPTSSAVRALTSSIDESSHSDDPDDFSAPYEVWRRGDHAVAIWMIWEATTIGVQRLWDALTNRITEFEEGRNSGLRSEAVATRHLIRAFSISNVGQFVGLHENRTNATLLSSARNPTALFGAGTIDSIPDGVIEQVARTRHRAFPAVKGRVSRLRDGRIGKFGWKGQMASLRDFTLTACAVELGLNVPGHDQAVVPYKPDYRSPGFDLTAMECDALVAFVARLPAPAQTRPANAAHAEYLKAGETLFTEIGCAACHIPQLGDVAGIYSDLLLHDMGPALAGAGSYGTVIPDTPDDFDAKPDAPAVVDHSAAAPSVKQKFRGPRRSEWRTPPLWGVRDSGPYLHDGQAETIPDAIAMHGGEAIFTTNKFFKLPHEQRLQLVSFLKTLAAPAAEADAAR